ncbi:MAG TPA: hypothetical protein VMN56_21990 [Casimicrobiaceae bacterium]|nr:hypothetical protein [Casimicrobiaceae bacterium]
MAKSVTRVSGVLAVVAAALALGFVHGARAQSGWTCSGLQSAVCATQLGFSGCASGSQVCDGSADALSNTGSATGCVCLTACTSSASCGTGEACIPQLGSHCTASFACNSDAGCPADAKCTLGRCAKVTSCSNNFDCTQSAPDCVQGKCTVVGPGQCSIDAQCGSDPCAGPQRCESNRCVATAARPCAGMPGAQCVASGGQAQCMIPACSSDAQCTNDPCVGPAQRCNVGTGRCEARDKPCQGELCQRVANSSDLAVCIPPRPEIPGGRIDVSPFDPDGFEIIWTTDPPTPLPGGRAYLLRVNVPAGALRAGARPGNMHVTVGAADRGLLIDNALAAPGKEAKWTRDASGVWHASGGSIASASLAPQGDRLRLEVRGRMIAAAPAPNVAKSALAAQVAVDWAGTKPSAAATTAVIDDCKSTREGARSNVVCTGRAPPKR